MDIRKLLIKDAKAYHMLRLEALRTAPDAFAASLENAIDKPVSVTEEKLAQENAVTFGAFINSRLVGNVTLSRHVSPKMNHRASVFAVYVTPEVRGGGVAKKLMEELIAYARTWAGLERLDLAVASHNEAATRLYKALGFETYGVDMKAMKTSEKYINENLMVKFL
ncbi:ribosomal protein S18 acetylase RimI-like enzyme [Planomicrobium soli]|uniref:Ribosomal protein S18 acetylase RimI-like enzyme n=1 Tax=Planomicrobium soli TaxID=1176648 RepID=A0A2P8H6T1_9BACL|nr:GNAT family N-acetyltransferase [Planomicrobium soli]PSL41922.1 ribosomal protein S18 acetylase RimI-like enzyme [Planomicrobium soli]